jgi:N-acetyl-anhydromuramyl-L-alanine amidase AmpD
MFRLIRDWWAESRRNALLAPTFHDLVVDNDGWLQGEGVIHRPSHPSWYYAELSSDRPIAVMAHYSVTKHGTALSMARRRQKQRKPADRAASWHVSLEGDGRIVQMISLLCGAWHCSRGVVVDAAGKRHRTNKSAIGIELISLDGSSYPAPQVEGAERTWAAIVPEYEIPIELAMLEHSVFDPARRKDPGPVWMGVHAPDVLGAAGLVNLAP